MRGKTIVEFFEALWMFEVRYQQQLAWEDAAQARLARDRAETQAAAQAKAMLDAHPSGALGTARLNDVHSLRKAGLLP